MASSDPATGVPRPPWWLAVPAMVCVIVLASLANDVVNARRYLSRRWVEAHAHTVDSLRVRRSEPIALHPAQPDDPARIWLLGSSSIAVPNHEAFNRPFAAALKDQAQPAIFDNLGWEGMPSWNVQERFYQAIEAASPAQHPQVVVLYLGHNDVTYTYTYALDIPHFHAVHAPLWVLTGRAFADNDDGHTYWMFCHRRSPKLLDLLQSTGLVHYDPDAFQPLLERTTRVYAQHIDSMVTQAQSLGARVMLVTPIGHIAMQPYGPHDSALAAWKEAQTADTYDARIDKLLAARDAETFTPDMRTKGPMLDVLRARGPNALDGPADISVCDVEAMWRAEGAGFDETQFLDPLHFTAEGYDRLTAAIARCLALGPLAPTPAAEP